MATRKEAPEPEEATFVFRGTVKKLKSATMHAVPVDENTAVVHVEQVMESPKSLLHTAGQDITVQLAGRSKPKAGAEYVFHATGWIFGEGVAVRALSQEPVARKHQALMERAGEPAEHGMSRRLKQRVDSADLVVSGQVLAVRLPAGAVEARRAAGAVPITQRPVSEHDPKWREAVIAVDKVHKGQHSTEEVTVMYPSSHDVRWFKAPKFQAGQKGFFVLHKQKVAAEHVAPPAHGVAAAGAAAGAEPPTVEVYTALHPLDFQPLSQPQMHKAIGIEEP